MIGLKLIRSNGEVTNKQNMRFLGTLEQVQVSTFKNSFEQITEVCKYVVGMF